MTDVLIRKGSVDIGTEGRQCKDTRRQPSASQRKSLGTDCSLICLGRDQPC
jgi:hypothetical protein